MMTTTTGASINGGDDVNLTQIILKRAFLPFLASFMLIRKGKGIKLNRLSQTQSFYLFNIIKDFMGAPS